MSDREAKYKVLFEKFYTDHYSKVKYFAMQYLNDEEDACNVAQEVFVSFWMNIENVDFNKNILAYLLTAAKNKSLNILSKESYRNKYKSDVIKDYYQTINQKLLKDNVTSNIFGKEIEGILQKAFEQMPQYVKETFVMCKLKGFKQREVAIILGISEKTVEQRMKRAMMVIRREFKDYLPFLFLFFKIGLYIYK